MNSGDPKSPSDWWCVLLPLASYGILAGVFFTWGGYVGDEGYYSLMSRHILEGLKPYGDFVCQQMPLMPYVYAAWFSVFGASIEAGRSLSVCMGLAAVFLTVLACRRVGGGLVGLAGGLLLAMNPHFVSDTILIKTQSLSVLLSAGLLYVLVTWDDRKAVISLVFAMGFATLAFFNRLTFLPSLVLIWMFLGWKSRGNLRRFLVVLTINLLLIGLAVFYFSFEGNMYDHVYRLHAEYWGGGPWSLGRLGWTVKLWIANQLPIIFVFACAMAVFLSSVWNDFRTRKLSEFLDSYALPAFILLSYWGYTALHWKSGQSYPTHQTSVAVLAVVFSMMVLSPYIKRLAAAAPTLCAFAFAVFLCLPMPFGEWALKLDGDHSMGRLHQAVAIMRKYGMPKDSVLTFNTELAVNGGFRIPVEYTLGEFSYFPNMPSDQASRMKVVNLEKILAQIDSSNFKLLCLGDREFAIMAGGNPDVAAQLKTLIDRKYLQVGSVKNYGQFNQELYIFAARY